jgi:hypothetical protein
VGRDAQDVINQQVGDEYDIFIGIFWHRFGTRTGRAGSGTEEEFERAYARNRQSGGVPAILVYFKEAPPPSEADAGQQQRLSCFRARLQERGVYYWRFENLDELRSSAFLHLSREVRAWLETPERRSRLSPRQGIQQECSRLFKQSLASIRQAVAATDVMREGLKGLRVAMAGVTPRLQALLRMGEVSPPRNHRAQVDKTLDGLVPTFQRVTDTVRTQMPVFRTECAKSLGDFARAAVMQATIGALSKAEWQETLSWLSVGEGGFARYRDTTEQLVEVFRRLPHGTARLDQAREECVLILSEVSATFAFALATTTELIRQFRDLMHTNQPSA